VSRFQLKLLAVVTMLIDHAGAILFPDMVAFRVIGRISFPIFAFLIAEGLFRTSNVKVYLGRLFASAVISEVPYDLAFHGTVYYPQSQNIFFTLFIGLAAIAMLREYYEKNPVASILLAGAAVLLAEVLRTDYGWFGVAAVVIFYCMRSHPDKGTLAFTLLNTGFGLLSSKLQIVASAAGLPILLYSGKSGRFRWKYFFYAFYPAHLLLLFLIHMVVK
jgi:TraX protein.